MTKKAKLDPADSLVWGPQIDRDLGITDRGRRKMVAEGRLPVPDGYLGGRAFWRFATYAAFKKGLFAGAGGGPGGFKKETK